MSQLTLRQIPRRVEQKLRFNARRSGLSLNKTAVSLLTRALGMEETQHGERKRDLSRFSGAMSNAQLKEFKSNTRSFETVDKELWKK
ncbi:MAG: hypothetical protein PHC61_02935 [Chitinivibrionales bacterium]|nr:hypothetical protein [Chitinivibrionales bacterium]